MSNQSIFIGADGSATSLRVGPKKGLSLQKLERAEITRVSDIRFSDEEQKFYIVFLSCPLCPAPLGQPRRERRGEATVRTYKFEHQWHQYGQTFRSTQKAVHYFDEYEQAVEEEINLINKLRRTFGTQYI